jgi:release factor glutamine methyltransferase
MYEPREDSLLLLKNLKKYCKNYKKDIFVLEIGTGSGILAMEAAKHAKVIATDIDKKLIEKLKKENENKNKNLEFIHSDLFSNINERFDLIIFNPPYLPSRETKHQDIDGGKHGTEIIGKFLSQARKFLNEQGRILLLCSSLNKNIEQLFEKYGYCFKKIDEEKFFFEKLLVYELFE